MGNCLTGDVAGGKQAIGGVQQRPTSTNNAGQNDAVDFFFRSRGQYPLFSQIELSLSASNLIDRDITSKSDPMAVMYLRKKDGKLEEIGRTEVILNSLNPNWIQKITVSFQFETVQTLVFHVFDVDTRYHNVPVKTLKLKEQDYLGEATCVLSEVMTKPNRSMTLNLHGNVGAGSLLRISRLVENSIVVPVCRTEVVDNNLNPIWKPLQMVIPVLQAIVEVGEVIQFYDSDRRFPAWGFGGRTADGHVSHAFNLNGASYGDEVVGVDGIMSAYSSALANVALAGPTLFSHVVDKAAHIASQSLSQNSPKYFVLLIITDGVLTDMTGTIDALVRASDLPLSVLIVGVGNTDFSQMEILDADKGRRLESSTGRVATRDIVQFVPMREVHSGQVSVVQALLEELPGQFLSYVRCRNINPVLKGQLIVDRFVEKVQYSFLDYISSGFELNFMVAVDFTASNGDPRTPSSLHYNDPSGRLNSYQKAIVEVGEVIQFYDSDRRFPAWGFGGRTADGHVSHAFNLNGASYGDEVVGVEGIMSAYSSALANVALAGPTLFSHVVDKAAHIASQSLSQNSPKYFVLLIITDGVLTDMAGTIDALVRASDLPLSVLIVGVGNTDFTQMEILDADKGRRLESSTGRVATRDIVQFVPMKDVHSGQVSVVQALLEELPGQFLSYVRCRNINPVGAPAI
ncbi:hypothetical protein Bca52824_079389 [Brassica carinata]|uniref:Protein BONZAI 3 n=1 Tax=Brassica carinata TaxID=52824 RepID=A0A8X7PZV4_BRACI|nr:hypothetical protein Bca52824_079389 [Brassica carinata]